MFRTEINIEAVRNRINLKDKIFSIGSCFAVNTGRKLEEYKFDILVNPFGTLFNPVSVFRAIEMGMFAEPLDEASYLQTQGVFLHFDLHSDISGLTRKELREKFEKKRQQAKRFLQDAGVVMITLGTAVVYEWKETGRIVANCHKVPGGEFRKRLLTVREIVEGFGSVHRLLSRHNPYIRFVVSVSPVRHIRDGFIINSQSKAILRLAVARMVAGFKNVSYFPSYEIMMDDLRDYRFYDRDMLHPSEEAIDYIWDKFRTAFLDDETLQFCKEWEKVKKDLAHRPYHPESKEHRQFLSKALKRLEQFQGTVDIEEERRQLRTQLGEG
jgi:hypothetical protein